MGCHPRGGDTDACVSMGEGGRLVVIYNRHSWGGGVWQALRGLNALDCSLPWDLASAESLRKDREPGLPHLETGCVAQVIGLDWDLPLWGAGEKPIWHTH